MDNSSQPALLAVIPLPTAEERRLREVNLARLMLVMVDIVLAGDPLVLETARDLLLGSFALLPGVTSAEERTVSGWVRCPNWMTKSVTPV